MKFLSTVSIMLLVAVLAGCGGGRTGSAPTLPNGKKIALLVNVEAQEPPTQTDKQKEALLVFRNFVQDDLVKVLKKYGYEARPNSKSGDPGLGRYNIHVTITRYNPGSAGARMWVGFGAGAAGVDLEYTMQGETEQDSLSGEFKGATGRDITNLARKANLQISEDVTTHLKQRFSAPQSR